MPLYIAGSCHLDLKGGTRLKRVLEALRPDAVALEFHMNGIAEERRANGRDREGTTPEYVKGYKEVLTPKQMESLSKAIFRMKDALGFEYRSISEYAMKHPKCNVAYVDLDIYRKGKDKILGGIEELLSSDESRIQEDPQAIRTMKMLLNKGPRGYLRNIESLADQFYNNNDMIKEITKMMRDPKTLEEMREELSEDALLAYSEVVNPERDAYMASEIRKIYSPDKVLLAVCGLAHMHGLEENLSDLKPEALSLLRMYEAVSKLTPR